MMFVCLIKPLILPNCFMPQMFYKLFIFAYCVYTLVAGDNYATQLYYIITKNIFLIIFAITSFGYFILILLARSRRDKGKLLINPLHNLHTFKSGYTSHFTYLQRED